VVVVNHELEVGGSGGGGVKKPHVLIAMEITCTGLCITV
jgi:hypothetical protein